MTASIRGGVAVAAALALTPAAPALAKTVHAHDVVTPHKVISCHQVKSGIKCFAPYVHEDHPEGKGFVALGRRGTSTTARGKETAASADGASALQVGDAWAVNGIRCTLKRVGLTCRNQDRHGFTLLTGGGPQNFVRQF